MIESGSLLAHILEDGSGCYSQFLLMSALAVLVELLSNQF